MAYLVHPLPQPSRGRVISTSNFGPGHFLLGNFISVDSKTVFQSSRLRGENIFQPRGHESLSVDLLTKFPFWTMTSLPAEYGPISFTLSTVQEPGLPAAQAVGVAGAIGVVHACERGQYIASDTDTVPAV